MLPRSKLVPLALPEGARLQVDKDGDKPGIESWSTRFSAGYNERVIRSQLPIDKPWQGLPWCREGGHDGNVEWSWASDTQSLEVTVESDGEILIANKPESDGRTDCDVPL